MLKTSTYQLNQWEPTDPISRADFNNDNAAIDAAIKSVTDGQATISQSIAALTTALGSGGHNCRMAYGTYAGNGKCGSANPTRISVDFYPVLVIVGQITSAPSLYWPGIFFRPATVGAAGTSNSITITWSNNGVQWYGESAVDQANYASYTYGYVVLGYTM